jgi:hypothetical protein
MTSRRKTPQQKKAESLKKDRRNTYGENAKSSRKNIPRRRAEGNQAVRRHARQALVAAAERADSEIVEAAEPQLRLKRLKGWKKLPDTPLGEVLERKRKRRRAAG